MSMFCMEAATAMRALGKDRKTCCAPTVNDVDGRTI